MAALGTEAMTGGWTICWRGRVPDSSLKLVPVAALGSPVIGVTTVSESLEVVNGVVRGWDSLEHLNARI